MKVNNILKFIFLMWAIFQLLALSSCVTRSACERKFPAETIVSTRYIDTLIYVPQISYDTTFQIDSFKVDVPVMVQDNTGQVSAKLWKDRYNKLYLFLNSKPNPVKAKIKYVTVNNQVPVLAKGYVKEWWRIAALLLGGLWILFGLFFLFFFSLRHSGYWIDGLIFFFIIPSE